MQGSLSIRATNCVESNETEVISVTVKLVVHLCATLQFRDSLLVF